MAAITEVQAVQAEENAPGAIEAPRYSCALGGAYSAALALFGAVPILHSGAGCGIGQLFGQHYAGGQNGGGPQGTTSTPCSSLAEEHVVFGGEEKLRQLIQSTLELMQGEIFPVITGCVPSLIGDDTEAVVKEFRDKAPVIHVKTAGFSGNSYLGYELFFDAIIEQLLTEVPVQKGLINIFGIVPYQHIFWKGDLAAIKQILEKLGLQVNIIFTEFQGLEKLKKIPAAELNVVLSPWNGHVIANKLREKFHTPYLTFPSVPVGPKATTQLIRAVGDALRLDSGQVESLIQNEERLAYRFTEYLGDVLILALPHPFIAVVADSANAIGITRYLTNEISYIPEVVIITDNPPAEYRANIINELSQQLDCAIKPDVIFEVDSHLIREKLQNRNFMILLASSLEKHIAVEELNAMHISVAFPTFDRLIVERTYAGYRGGLSLMEDIISKYCGPL
jgi:nitrogenase molybdenum-iron protein beta chain